MSLSCLLKQAVQPSVVHRGETSVFSWEHTHKTKLFVRLMTAVAICAHAQTMMLSIDSSIAGEPMRGGAPPENSNLIVADAVTQESKKEDDLNNHVSITPRHRVTHHSEKDRGRSPMLTGRGNVGITSGQIRAKCGERYSVTVVDGDDPTFPQKKTLLQKRRNLQRSNTKIHQYARLAYRSSSRGVSRLAEYLEKSMEQTT